MSSSITILTFEDLDPRGLMSFLALPPAVRWLAWYNDTHRFPIRGIKLPKYQRGSVGAFPQGTVAAAAAGGEVVLTTHTKASTRFSAGTTTATFAFESDGELWGNATGIQGNTQYAGEWWSEEPESGIGSSYAVRNLSSGKTGTFSTQSAADNTWITMSANRLWTRSRSSQGTSTVTATFEVGPAASGPADDSAALTLQATVDQF